MAEVSTDGTGEESVKAGASNGTDIGGGTGVEAITRSCGEK